MLERTLEPEIMDLPHDAADYDAMDHRTVNQCFVDDLLVAGLLQAALPFPGEPDVVGYLPLLDVGTGTAQIPVLLAQQCEQPLIIAADAAIEMLQLAKINVEIAAVQDRIQLDYADAKELPYADELFAVVMSNSIMHHIPEPLAVIVEMIRVCRSGGLIFVRDLLRPDSAAEVERIVELYAGTAEPHQQQLFRDSLHAALTLDEIRLLVASQGFAPETVMQTSDRHWTWSAWKP